MSASNPFFINTNICYGPEDTASIREFAKSISGNTGNSYIAYAMIRLIFGNFTHPDEIKNIYTHDFSHSDADAEYINAHNSHVVFILQDQIRIDESYGLELPFEKIIAFLKKIKKPIIVVSLGANSFTGYDSSFYKKLDSRRVCFFQNLASLVASMGVRGGFTVEVLKQLGINNAEAVGCPSFFEEGRGRRVYKKESTENFRLALGGLLYKTNILDPVYILQDEMELIEALYFSSKDYAVNTSYETDFDLRAAVEGRYRAFSSIEDWKGFLKPFHLMFGTRVHGAIAALNAGVPSLIFNPDSRAREMSELFAVPYMPELNGQENIDIFDIYSRLDYGEMNSRYDRLYDAYLAWLRKNGIVLGAKEAPMVKQPALLLNSKDLIADNVWALYNQKNGRMRADMQDLQKAAVNDSKNIDNIGIKGIIKVLAKKLVKKIKKGWA